MEFSLKIFCTGTLTTLLLTMPLYTAIQDSLPEFYARNPDCSAEDTESAIGLLRSSFKKSESFRLVLLAMAGSFFIGRLCTELGRIIIDAQETAREKVIAGQQEADVIGSLAQPEKTAE